MSGLGYWRMDGIWAHSAACAFRDETSPDPTIDHGRFRRAHTYTRTSAGAPEQL